jgi:hypothetical protein
LCLLIPISFRTFGRELFAEYFEELATPKDAPNFSNQHLKDSERRFNLIKEISKSEEKKKFIGKTSFGLAYFLTFS